MPAAQHFAIEWPARSGTDPTYSVWREVQDGCAPWKGGAFQWVQIPPGNRSSRKQPEQSWR